MRSNISSFSKMSEMSDVSESDFARLEGKNYSIINYIYNYILYMYV